jgi:hypothetical protein
MRRKSHVVKVIGSLIGVAMQYNHINMISSAFLDTILQVRVNLKNRTTLSLYKLTV